VLIGPMQKPTAYLRREVFDHQSAEGGATQNILRNTREGSIPGDIAAGA